MNDLHAYLLRTTSDLLLAYMRATDWHIPQLRAFKVFNFPTEAPEKVLDAEIPNLWDQMAKRGPSLSS